MFNWSPPRNLEALQSFLGFSTFSHNFIKNYSKKISSLTKLIKKYSVLPLNEEALSKFHQLKEALNTAPILSHLNPSLLTIVETDASDYALGAVLSRESILLHSIDTSSLQKNSTMNFMTRSSLA
ncbi:hypothetical protein O181_086009 [Austropuccinia psidii MF-1]|uniref:Reverse transcriptase/retrotransposon-derived protein RNase H-like domain-containing protein n=1 Tax=Austropuccinia psidii MF-1 TaxID=1389203 RepID=A0A9Q3IN73_9BASI|nr:hypothetical protein [Austropuccinia psidii MF-1]